MPITYDLLNKQNAETSNAIIDAWKNNKMFLSLSRHEGAMTVARDNEDASKLQIGIDYAKSKGVIDPDFKPEPYVQVDVLGKTPDQVADEIIDKVNTSSGSSTDESKSGGGSVIVLCGLSGTGKGTTVTKLRQKMEAAGKKVVTWSNGNIFRSVTLLAATWCEQNGIEGFDQEKALTKENLEDFISMLSFNKFRGNYDTRIRGLGLELYVSQVQNTDLKGPKVSKNIPTVAQFTQGEVILFAAKAVETMGQDGIVVLLEGREQTVNYVRTPHRFTLALSDDTLIGKRRAAQRLMAAAIKELPEATNDAKVLEVFDTQLKTMVDEIDVEPTSGNYLFCLKWFGKKTT